MTERLLAVRNLRLTIPVASGLLHALRGVDLSLDRGKTLGIVGESGSGKSLTALSLLGLQPRHSTLEADAITFDGLDLRSFGERRLAREIRGRRAGMIFQEPMTSLNPVVPVGRQLTEVMAIHGLSGAAEARDRAIKLLERVGIAGASRRLHQYPHQFSGGQRQRIMIAMALMPQPQLLIADEPTTALDVTVQAEILRLLAELREELGMAMVLVTHNLGIVSRIADEVAVMYAGQVVEQAPTRTLFGDPRHPYTRGLLAALPEIGRVRGGRLGAIPGIVPSLIGGAEGCAFAPRCSWAEPRCRETPPVQITGPDSLSRCIYERPPARAAEPRPIMPESGKRTAEPVLVAKDLARRYTVSRGIFAPKAILRAVDGVDLTVMRGEVVAIVGESGCGKSTLARLLLGLEAADDGDVILDGRALAAISPRERARLIQPVFQDPRASLNPRRSVREIIRRPLDVHRIGALADRDRRAHQLMEQVGLPERLLHAYPAQLSGGQRQRVAIARALVLEPRLLLCDEPTSALDVSVQAQVLNLLADLRARLDLTFVLITHDLSVVRHMADRVAVMYLGRIVERGETSAIFSAAQHPYTRALLQAALPVAPSQGVPQARILPGFPNPLDMPPGCPFSPRCPDAIDICRVTAPAPTATGRGEVRCHLAAATPVPQSVEFA